MHAHVREDLRAEAELAERPALPLIVATAIPLLLLFGVALPDGSTPAILEFVAALLGFGSAGLAAVNTSTGRSGGDAG